MQDMTPDISRLSFVSDPIMNANDLTPVQIKNRRLQYLRTHPEYFATRSSTLHERVYEPASGHAFTEDLPTE